MQNPRQEAEAVVMDAWRDTARLHELAEAHPAVVRKQASVIQEIAGRLDRLSTQLEV